jgi:hypothetical protein
MRLVRIHGVDNAMDNVIGNGGTEGAFGDLLLIRGAKLGEHVLPIPDGLPMAQA